MNLEKEAINESLLQSYRAIFTGSQAIFLALGGFILNENFVLVIVLALLCLLQIWFIWYDIVFSRAKIVDYYKFSIGERFDNCGVELGGVNAKTPISEVEYVKSKFLRKIINQKIDKNTFRETRIKIDILLPAIYSVMWIGLAIYSVIKAFSHC